MNKKIIFGFFIFILSAQVFAVVVPFALAATRLASVTVGASATAAGATTAGTALTTLIVGAYVGYINITREDSAEPITKYRSDDVYLTNKLREPSPAEANALFTPGYPHVTPPPTKSSSSSYSCYFGYYSAQMGYGNSKDGACSAALALFTGSTTFRDKGGDCNSSCYADEYHSGSLWERFVPAHTGTVEGCPLGYANPVSGQCSLAQPDAVERPTDGFCPILRNGNSYSADSTDPDCTGSNATPQFSPDGTATIRGSDGRSVTITGLNAAGEMTITTKTPDPVTGTTKTNEVKMQAGATPDEPYLVIGESEVTTVGTGASETGTPVAPSVSVDNSGLIDAIGNQMAQTQAIEDARIAKEASDRVIPSFTDVIPKETIPVTFVGVNFTSSAVCPAPIAYSMMGTNYTLSYDPMCTLMTTMRPLFLALGAFSAAFIFMGGIKL